MRILLLIIIVITFVDLATTFFQSKAEVIVLNLHGVRRFDELVYDAPDGKYYVESSKSSSKSKVDSKSYKEGKRGGKRIVRDIDKVRESGEIFLRKKSPRRHLPWWMKDSERNHPRILPPYKPWWLNSQNPIVNPSWTVPELRAEAIKRGAHCSHWNKQELLDWLKESSADYNLSEMNFKGPTFTNEDGNVTDNCYPEVYSKVEGNTVN